MKSYSIKRNDTAIVREVVVQAKGLIEGTLRLPVELTEQSNRQILITDLTCSISGLATASNDEERISVLKLSLIVFDHHEVRVHDHMVETGATIILMRCLQRTISDSCWEQVGLICQLLQMNYRCSDEQAIASLIKIGAELIPTVFFVGLQSIIEIPKQVFQHI